MNKKENLLRTVFISKTYVTGVSLGAGDAESTPHRVEKSKNPYEIPPNTHTHTQTQNALISVQFLLIPSPIKFYQKENPVLRSSFCPGDMLSNTRQTIPPVQ